MKFPLVHFNLKRLSIHTFLLHSYYKMKQTNLRIRSSKEEKETGNKTRRGVFRICSGFVNEPRSNLKG